MRAGVRLLHPTPVPAFVPIAIGFAAAIALWLIATAAREVRSSGAPCELGSVNRNASNLSAGLPSGHPSIRRLRGRRLLRVNGRRSACSR